MPSNNAQKYLQVHYTLPAAGASTAPEDAGDGSAWSAANVRFNKYFREIATRFEYRDVMLLDTRGNVVYSVNKGPALGTNILTGPYRESNLRGAYEKAMAADAVDFVWITDFQPFQAAGGMPIAWLVSPIGLDGQNKRRDGAAAADLEDQPDHDRRPAVESRRHGRHRRDVFGGPGRVDAFGLTAVPGRPAEVSTRRHRGGHPTRHRRQGDPLARHDAGAAGRDRGFRAAQRGQSGTVTDTGYSGDHEIAAYTPVDNAEFRSALVDPGDHGTAQRPLRG